ncbi:hypothetical protein, partial [Streptomyces griseus]|uniref:hypothetical protein n=1 Tax=Streptomyces griseus TaxID=1911 RepID=UPI003CD069AA
MEGASVTRVPPVPQRSGPGARGRSRGRCGHAAGGGHTPVPERSHGFLVQLYSLLSARSWGMGDL